MSSSEASRTRPASSSRSATSAVAAIAAELVTDLPVELQRGFGESDVGRNEPSRIRVSRCPLQQLGALARLLRQLQRVLEVSDSLLVRSEPCGAIGRRAKADARLGADGIGLGALIRRSVRGEVMGGERAGGFVRFRCLQVAGGGEVPAPALAHGERVVGDLADQRLDEPILAPLR